MTGQRKTALVLVLAAASWGFGTILSKYALDEVPALTLLPIQLAASVLVLAILLYRRGVPKESHATSPILGRLGILNPGLAYTFTLLGLASISASLVVLIGAIEPVVILVLATVFLRERVTPTMVALSVCALAGTLVVVYDPTSSGEMIGLVLATTGVACCAVYTVIARRWIGTADSTLRVVAVQQAYALVFAIVLFGLVGLIGGRAVLPSSPLGWASAIGSGRRLLRGGLLVLPDRSPSGAGLCRGRVLLPYPRVRGRGERHPPGRTARSRPMARRRRCCRSRHRLDPS